MPKLKPFGTSIPALAPENIPEILSSGMDFDISEECRREIEVLEREARRAAFQARFLFMG